MRLLDTMSIHEAGDASAVTHRRLLSSYSLTTIGTYHPSACLTTPRIPSCQVDDVQGFLSSVIACVVMSFLAVSQLGVR